MISARKIVWTGQITRMEEKLNVCKILIGKPEGRRIRRTLEDNIKIDLK
jgi:hypothetical protein